MGYEMNQQLTERQKEIYDFFVDETMRTGIQPSYRQAMKHFGFTSLNAIPQFVNAIEKKGWWTYEKLGHSRALKIPEVIEAIRPALEKRGSND